ncbi:hypothetical protein [[Clostridium] fimetarium]|nr:hypothetical protein [[Clostridium] fimetarium]
MAENIYSGKAMALKPMAEKAKAEKYMVEKLYRESYDNGEI